MKKLNLIFLFLFLAIAAHSAQVRTWFQLPFSTENDTNQFTAQVISSNILASGGVIPAGLPVLITPATNGYATNYFNTGWYALRPKYAPPVVIAVTDPSATQIDYTNLLRSGFNTYVTIVLGTNGGASGGATYNFSTNFITNATSVDINAASVATVAYIGSASNALNNFILTNTANDLAWSNTVQQATNNLRSYALNLVTNSGANITNTFTAAIATAGTSSTNFTTSSVAASGTGITNFIIGTSNNLAGQITTSSNGLASFAQALAAGNSAQALAIGSANSNLTFGVGAQLTNNLTAQGSYVSNAIPALQAATNNLNALGANGTNYANAVGLSNSNLTQSVGSYVSNAIPALGNSLTNIGNVTVIHAGISTNGYPALSAAISNSAPGDTLVINSPIYEGTNQLQLLKGQILDGYRGAIYGNGLDAANPTKAQIVPNDNCRLYGVRLYVTNAGAVYNCGIGAGTADHGFTNVIAVDCEVTNDSDSFMAASTSLIEWVLINPRGVSCWDNINQINNTNSVTVIISPDFINNKASTFANISHHSFVCQAGAMKVYGGKAVYSDVNSSAAAYGAYNVNAGGTLYINGTVFDGTGATNSTSVDVRRGSGAGSTVISATRIDGLPLTYQNTSVSPVQFAALGVPFGDATNGGIYVIHASTGIRPSGIGINFPGGTNIAFSINSNNIVVIDPNLGLIGNGLALTNLQSSNLVGAVAQATHATNSDFATTATNLNGFVLSTIVTNVSFVTTNATGGITNGLLTINVLNQAQTNTNTLASTNFVNAAIAASGTGITNLINTTSNSLQSQISSGITATNAIAKFNGAGTNTTLYAPALVFSSANFGTNNFSDQSAGSAILSGNNNLLTNNSAAVIAGGQYNSIGGGPNTGAVIGGGYLNTNNSTSATIGGGYGNLIGSQSFYATISGGIQNSIASGSSLAGATIAGGGNNYIGQFGANGFIGGGASNYVGNSYSSVLGFNARATNGGGFIFSDFQPAAFYNTDTNQFLVRAANGVGINTNNPGTNALKVLGNVDATSFSVKGIPMATPASAVTNNQSGVTLGFNQINVGIKTNLLAWTNSLGCDIAGSTEAQGTYVLQTSKSYTNTASTVIVTNITGTWYVFNGSTNLYTVGSTPTNSAATIVSGNSPAANIQFGFAHYANGEVIIGKPADSNLVAVLNTILGSNYVTALQASRIIVSNVASVVTNGATDTQVATWNAAAKAFYPSNAASGGSATSAFPATNGTWYGSMTNDVTSGPMVFTKPMTNQSPLAYQFASMVFQSSATNATNQANFGFYNNSAFYTNTPSYLNGEDEQMLIGYNIRGNGAQVNTNRPFSFSGTESWFQYASGLMDMERYEAMGTPRGTTVRWLQANIRFDTNGNFVAMPVNILSDSFNFYNPTNNNAGGVSVGVAGSGLATMTVNGALNVDTNTSGSLNLKHGSQLNIYSPDNSKSVNIGMNGIAINNHLGFVASSTAVGTYWLGNAFNRFEGAIGDNTHVPLAVSSWNSGHATNYFQVEAASQSGTPGAVLAGINSNAVYFAPGFASYATNNSAAVCLSTSATAITNKLTAQNCLVKFSLVSGTYGIFNNAGTYLGGQSAVTATTDWILQPNGYITNTSGALTVNVVGAF